ncbi:hypothetical protein Droror1_Dr00024207 [Drosera rotundifolia]
MSTAPRFSGQYPQAVAKIEDSRSGLGEEEACGGCCVMGYSIGERKEERKRRRKEERKRRRKEESPALCVFDFCRREKERELLGGKLWATWKNEKHWIWADVK